MSTSPSHVCVRGSVRGSVRRRGRIVGITSACALVAAVLSPGPAVAAQPAGRLPAQPAAVAQAAPDGLRLVRTRHSLTATHRWYQQTFRGLDVVDGYLARHDGAPDGLSAVDDGRLDVPRDLTVTPQVSADAASGTAVRTLALRARLRAGDPGPKAGFAPVAVTADQAVLAVAGGARPALVWSVLGESGEGLVRTLVDARTGVTRDVTVLTRSVDGRGRVFAPNPVVTLRDESLRDRDDRDQAALRPAYQDVVLRNLDGSGTLSGRYAKIVKAKGGKATSATNTFRYTRSDDRFEQVNAYYAVNQTQEYLHRLGFTDVNSEAQRLVIDTIAWDNSWYVPSRDVIVLGTGGVDDAEDAEVIWHEYGHAIQDDQVPHYGRSEEAGAIGEGFGDYWAVTNSVPVSGGFDLPCVMDWDATSYTADAPHCLRRTDTGKTTDDMTYEVHDDGEIWSAALWRINRELGRRAADRVIVESQFFYAPATSFADAAKAVVATAKALYGGHAATVVRSSFVTAKILS